MKKKKVTETRINGINRVKSKMLAFIVLLINVLQEKQIFPTQNQTIRHIFSYDDTLFSSFFWGGLNYPDAAEVRLPDLAPALPHLTVVNPDKRCRNDPICSPPFSPLHPDEDKTPESQWD